MVRVRVTRARLLTALLLALPACVARSALLFETKDSDSNGDGSSTPTSSWGEYVATLPELPACAPSPFPDLVVTATDLGVDGPVDVNGWPALADPGEAGPSLSLAEALWIARNRAGWEIIRFDTVSFPLATPTTLAVVAGDMPDVVPEICLDARGAGVRLDFSAIPADCTSRCALTVNNSRLLGLELIGSHLPQRLGANTEMAMVRLIAADRPLVMAGTVTVGPHNVISGSQSLVESYAAVTILNNWLGYDPQAQTVMGADNGVFSWARQVVIVNNVVANFSLTAAAGDDTTYRLRVTGNWLGQEPGGRLLAASDGQFQIDVLESLFAAPQVDIGPDNVVAERMPLLIHCNPNASVAVTHNQFADTGASYVPTGDGVAVPPTIMNRTAAGIGGECPAAGQLELFAASAGQPQQWLGSAACSVGATWQVDATVPAGAQLVATMTPTSGCTSAFSTPWTAP